MSQNTQTLMLDAGYAPIGVLPWQRAIQMLFLGKVEVISEYENEVRSTYLVIKIPAVVRLLGKVRRKKKMVKFSRSSVYGRDDYKCQYCGKELPMGELTYDHVIPRAQGGKTEWTNIVSCCPKCNEKKACRTPEQARMHLIKMPVQPKDTPRTQIRVSLNSIPDAWRDYLYWTTELETDGTS